MCLMMIDGYSSEMIELQARLFTTCQRLQNQILQQDATIVALRQQCRDMKQQLDRHHHEVGLINARNRLGQVVEYLAANDNSAAVRKTDSVDTGAATSYISWVLTSGLPSIYVE